VTTNLGGNAPQTGPLVRKIGWTMLTGFVAFAGSTLLDNVLRVSLADQLVLTFITGGVTLVVQYLADFEERLRETQRYQRHLLDELRETVQRGFAGVSEATTLMEDIERSALSKEWLTITIRRSGNITASVTPLLRAIAESEIVRLSKTLQALGDGHELLYDGEDRELLLALTRHAKTSIVATTWAIDGPGGPDFEAGFWYQDLGGRYLELQRAAVRRGVSVRRIFVYESDDVIEQNALQRVLAMQQRAGIEVRLLGSEPTAPGEPSPDFVLFDGEVCYDTNQVTRGSPVSAPWLLTTRVIFDETEVGHRAIRFDELWEAAEPLRPLRREIR
jgi:hypothetical protein